MKIIKPEIVKSDYPERRVACIDYPNLSREMKTAHPYELMGKSWHSCQSIRKERPLLQTDRDVQTWSEGNAPHHSPIPQLPSSAHINIPSWFWVFFFFPIFRISVLFEMYKLLNPRQIFSLPI